VTGPSVRFPDYAIQRPAHREKMDEGVDEKDAARVQDHLT